MHSKPKLLILIALAAVAISMAASPAVAQSNETETGGIEITTNTTTDEPETYAQEIGPVTRIVKWEYNDDRDGFEIVYETDRSTSITITEAVQFGEGAGSGRIYRQRLPEGSTRVFVKVPRRAGQAAITMVTPGSLRQNSYSFVSTGQTEQDKPPISYERAQLLIGGTALGASGLVFGLVRKRRNDEDKEYERIL